ncbi:MAG: ATP-binding cassette domain-containing protein, partial [Negativicoccus succinicivorans]|nr:ATP-binding cassette domain-containing protein [Negativicoccus succinicivorans]
MALLETTSVAKIFGGIKAVQDFTIHIDAGELIGLIGPNGAGKTTAFNLLTGVYRPSMGEIRFDGQSLVGKKPYQITAAGIARTFQNIRLFGDLSVLENVKIACNLHARYTLLESVLRVGRYGREEEAIEARALQLLQLFNLDAKRDELARNLPYGE